jgi:hypothetical protein
MDRTTAPGSIAGQYIDDDPPNEIQGTLLVAADRNAIQEELIHLITQAGLTPSAGTLTQVRQAVEALRDAIAASTILTKLLTVDGSGSGLDTDLVRATTPGTRGLQYLAGANVAALAALILSDIKTVDGTGSGLDADLLQGANGANFVFGSSASATTFANDLDVITKAGFYRIATTATGSPFSGGVGTLIHVGGLASDGDILGLQIAARTSSAVYYIRRKNTTWSAWEKLWTEGNDGAGSGLDADLLDGVEGVNYVRHYLLSGSESSSSTITLPTMAAGESAIVFGRISNDSGGSITITYRLPAGNTYAFKASIAAQGSSAAVATGMTHYINFGAPGNATIGQVVITSTQFATIVISVRRVS